MIIDTQVVCERYDIPHATLRTKRPIIKEHDGIYSDGRKGVATLFYTSVLDKLARDGLLGNRPMLAMRELDSRNLKETS